MINENPLHTHSLLICLLLSLSLLLLQVLTGEPPSPKSADLPDSEFSAYRAETTLRALLAENQPHPVGTAENRLVKSRIIEKLQDYKLQTVEQKTIGCSFRYPSCAWVENVLAKIPGTQTGPAVLLMAHYDSVPMAPGAGDDGAGVAALLEIARTLANEAPFKNPIMFAFTDAEEMGLLGAEAFFKEHPWAMDVGVVLNVEGSGSGGVSTLLRTGADNSWLVKAYRDSVYYRSGVSLTNELFKRMPNDTDFSVAQRANLPGIDFAFAGERNHYHTPLDTVDNLNLGTLQHHGENLLPLTRLLANMDLTHQAKGDSVYLALFYRLWFAWPQQYSMMLCFTSLLLLAVAAVNLLRTSTTNIKQISIGLSIGVLVLVAVFFINLVVFKAIEFANGTMVSWPAHYWPLRLCLVGATLTAGLATLLIMGRLVNFWSLLLGVWILWALISLAATWVAPSASNVLLIPTSFASLVIYLSSTILIRWPLCRELTACLCLLVATPFTLGLFLPLEQSQGYGLIVSTFIPLGLFMATLAPLLLNRVSTGKLLSGSIGLIVIGCLFAVSLPLYSLERPQHLNILHIQDRDRGTAHWLIDSPDPLPQRIRELAPFAESDQSVTPWTETNRGPIAPAEITDDPAPLLNLISASTSEGIRELKLHFQSQRGANYAMILIDEAADLKFIRIEGRPQPTQLSPRIRRSVGDHYAIRMSGVPAEGFELELGIGNPDPINCYVIDWTTQLPATASDLLDARTPLATPVHQGDQALIFTRTSI